MFKEFLTTGLDILFPKSCHICSKVLNRVSGAYDDNICWDCFSSMRKAGPVTDPPGGPMACFIYEGAARELIHRFKYANRPYLSDTIVNLMMQNLNPALLRDIDYIMPVPLHPVRLREREYNQSELIARGLCRKLNKPLSLAVRRIRNTKPQAKLDNKKRSSNLKNAFALALPSSVSGKNILLVDDVVTTTATAGEVSRILKKAGANKVSILAFARG